MSNPLSGIDFPDDASRPTAPEITKASPNRGHGHGSEHLKMIHDHHRRNMVVIAKLIERAAKGEMTPDQVTAEAQALPLNQNYLRFGALCGQHCQIVHTHHSIEDAHMFPMISAKSQAWNKVIDRLKAEHEIVHELLVRTIDAINTLAHTNAPADFTNARTLYEALEKLLLSHFSYEEKSVGPALDHFGLAV